MILGEEDELLVIVGTGNSVPDYVSLAGYLAMNEAIREYRGE